MIEVVLGFVVMGMIIIAMSVGVLFGRKPIKGSCGGVAAALGEEDYVCELCGNDPNKCDSVESEQVSQTGASQLGYEIKS